MKIVLFSIFIFLIFFIPLEAVSQIDYYGRQTPEFYEEVSKIVPESQKEYYLEMAEKQREDDRQWWRLFVVTIVILPTITYFATWAFVKKVLHKKNPKLIGIIFTLILFSVLVFTGIPTAPFIL